ncbi:MAG: hypothetical protein N838_24680 [Thiohalocapsa sp. PB-PSB1]|nr:MAG: hypothetical protein N838_24680 [Thiohalocapsa sp. PB-PSB1]
MKEEQQFGSWHSIRERSHQVLELKTMMRA